MNKMSTKVKWKHWPLAILRLLTFQTQSRNQSSLNRELLHRVHKGGSELNSKSVYRGSTIVNPNSNKNIHNRSYAGSALEANLLSNKKTRQVLESDKALLSNRIIMLRKEEERLFKKIQGTKEKADKILEIKQRNQEKFQRKLEFEELERLRIDKEREKYKEERERRKREFEMNQKITLENKKQVFLDFKQQKDYAVNQKYKIKLNTIKHNKIKRDVVKEEEIRIQEKLRQREEEKRKRNQLHYSMRVDNQK